MSAPAFTWAQGQTVGQTGRKATLLLMADIASEHGVLWAGAKYLAEILECERTTVVGHLRQLEADGFILRIERRKPNGAKAGMVTVLGPAGDRGAMRDPADHEIYGELISRGLSRDYLRRDLPQPKSGKPSRLSRDSRQEPLTEPLEEPSATPNGRARDGKVALPEGFPDALRPHLAAAYRVLRDLALRIEANEVRPVALANVLMARPRKALVRSAHDYAAWVDGQSRPRKDVVAGYRNWLDREPNLATVERLSEGVPIGPAASGRHNATNGAGPLKSATYSRGRSWDELTPREQQVAKENAAIGVMPGQPRHACKIERTGNGITNLLDD